MYFQIYPFIILHLFDAKKNCKNNGSREKPSKVMMKLDEFQLRTSSSESTLNAPEEMI
jgi:hypothetical protein